MTRSLNKLMWDRIHPQRAGHWRVSDNCPVDAPSFGKFAENCTHANDFVSMEWYSAETPHPVFSVGRGLSRIEASAHMALNIKYMETTVQELYSYN